MQRIIQGKIDAKGLKFGIVVSRFNNFISDKLLEGALDALERNGADEKNIDIVKVPGSFEIPIASKKMINKGGYDAIICLGAIIKGDTPHFDYIAAEVTKGIANLSLETEIPIAFGVITTDNIEQAIERAGAKMGNKGWESAINAIEMANLIKTFK